MVPVPRKARVPLSIDNARGVLCSNHAGKIFAKCARSNLTKWLRSAVGEGQQGAIPGGGVDFPSVAVRKFVALQRQKNLSSACIFTDVKAAFYTVMTEIATGPVLDDQERGKLFQQFGLTVVDAAKIVDIIASVASEMAEQGVPAAWADMVRDWHKLASFSIQGATTVVVPSAGTRPGDPLSDLIFAVAFGRLQADLMQQLAEAGLEVTIPVVDGGIFAATGGGDISECRVELPTFMDDMAILLADADPWAIVDQTGRAMEIVQRVCTRYGFSLNLKEGKTEAMIALRGVGAEATKQWLLTFREDEGRGTLILPTPGGPLRVVEAYRHLGVMATAARSHGREMASRKNSALSAGNAMASRFFSNLVLPVKDRVQVSHACIDSRALYMAGTWGRPSQCHLRPLAHAVMKPLRRIARAHKPPELDEAWVSDACVRRQLGAPRIEALIIAARCRFAARASRSAPRYVVALLQSDGSLEWRGELINALVVVRSVLGRETCLAAEPSMGSQCMGKVLARLARSVANTDQAIPPEGGPGGGGVRRVREGRGRRRSQCRPRSNGEGLDV